MIGAFVSAAVLAAAIQGPWTISGRAVGANGAPAAAARVRLERDAGDFEAFSTAAEADAQGYFQLEVPDRAGTWRLRVDAGTAFAVLHDLPGDWGAIDVGNVAVHSPVELRGVVKDEEGAPIASATVRCGSELEGATVAATATTDVTGAFLLTRVPRGRCWIGAEAASRADGFRRGMVVAESSDPVILTMARERHAEGRVLDDGGAPVGGAAVLVTPVGPRAAPWREAVLTKSDGAFAFPGLDLGEGRLEIRVSKPGFVSLTRETRWSDFGKPLVLRRGLPVEVRVEPPAPLAKLDLESTSRVGEGYTAESVSVEPRDLEAARRGRVRLTAAPGAFVRAHGVLRGGALVTSGHVEVASASEGVPVIVLDTSKATPPPQRTDPRVKSTTDSQPAEPVRLEGRIAYGVARIGEPTPVALYKSVFDLETKARRTVFVVAVLADSDGAFVVPGIAPGRYAVVPKRPAPAWCGSHRTFTGEMPPFERIDRAWIVEVPGGVAVYSAEVAIPRPQDRFVVGSVWVDGRPLPGAELDLTPRSGSAGAGSATTGADGRYRIPITAAGEFELALRAPGIRETRLVKLVEGQSRHVDFGGSRTVIRGRLVGEEGEPVSCDVLLQRACTPENTEWFRVAPPRATADAEGRFSFSILTSGRYRVVTSDPTRRRAVVAGEAVEVAAGRDAELPPLRVPRACQVRVSAEGAGGSRGTGRVWILADDGAVELAHLAQGWLFAQHSAIVVHGLPPGRYRVKMPAYEERVVELVAGAGPVDVRFADPKLDNPVEPASRSAYRSREARAQELWDFGGETPELYEPEVIP